MRVAAFVSFFIRVLLFLLDVTLVFTYQFQMRCRGCDSTPRALVHAAAARQREERHSVSSTMGLPTADSVAAGSTYDGSAWWVERRWCSEGGDGVQIPAGGNRMRLSTPGPRSSTPARAAELTDEKLAEILRERFPEKEAQVQELIPPQPKSAEELRRDAYEEHEVATAKSAHEARVYSDMQA